MAEAAEIVAKPVEALGYKAFKKVKSAMSKDLDNNIERLGVVFCFLKATLQNVDPFEASNNIEPMEIESLQILHDDLNLFFTKLASRTAVHREVMGSRGFTSKVCSFLSSPKHYHLRFKYAPKVNDLTSRITSLASIRELCKNLAINPSGRHHDLRTPSEDTSSLPVSDVFIGRDTDKANIINLLDMYSIVAIVGVGGQGKTTLAHHVCLDDRVRGSFNKVLWVSLNPKSTVNEILEKIIASAIGVKPNNCGLQELQQQVLQTLVGKRFLLVLDNVSYVANLRDDSEKLNVILKLGGFWSNGGKTLITTRSKAAAKLMDTLKLYELSDLAEDDCWILLQSYAIKQEDKKESGVEEIGKEIAKMCPKVPLVLKIIGCHLADKDYISQWQHVRNELASSPTAYMLKDGNMKQVLKLCYDRLDNNLKRCAAYCSLFPKGHVYDKNYMVRNWIALGFVEPSKGMSLEDVGDLYVRDLTQRGFFEEARNFEVFKMHDVMHDLMLLIGKEKHQMIDSKTQDIAEGVSHVSLNRQDLNWEVLLSSISGKQTLESILLISRGWDNEVRGEQLGSGINKLIPACQQLKVLEIYNQEIRKVPKSIGKLKLVKHLNLSHNLFSELPNEITKMENLLTLDLLYCCNLQELPREIGKLKNLLSLDLQYCKRLEELPKDMGKLVKLRHLRVRGCDRLRCMPEGFGNLRELEELDVFVVGESRSSSRLSKAKGGAKLHELGHLNNLKGRLCIQLTGASKYIVSEAKEAHLEKKTKLTMLRIEFVKKAEEDEKFLEGIQLSGKNWEKLSIRNYGGKRLPTWMTDDRFHERFPKLDQFYLSSDCWIPAFSNSDYDNDEWMSFRVKGNEDDVGEWVPRYSRIKEHLKMGNIELQFTTRRRDGLTLTDVREDVTLEDVRLFIWDELAPRSGGDCGGLLLKSCFPNLTELWLLGIPELEVIPEEFRDLSSLKELKICQCPKLKEIPDWIDTLSSLKYLTIEDAPEVKVLPNSIGSLTSLLMLQLRGFSGLESLPRQISKLPKSCELRIVKCSKPLFEKCAEPGEYWPLLQHLTHIYIKSCEGDYFQYKREDDEISNDTAQLSLIPYHHSNQVPATPPLTLIGVPKYNCNYYIITRNALFLFFVAVVVVLVAIYFV